MPHLKSPPFQQDPRSTPQALSSPPPTECPPFHTSTTPIRSYAYQRDQPKVLTSRCNPGETRVHLSSDKVPTDLPAAPFSSRIRLVLLLHAEGINTHFHSLFSFSHNSQPIQYTHSLLSQSRTFPRTIVTLPFCANGTTHKIFKPQ